MRVIRYNNISYAPNIMLIVAATGNDVPRVITPDGIQELPLDNGQWTIYANMSRLYMYEELDLVEYAADYEFFTIDMLGYDDLYMLTDGDMLKVLDGYDDLVNSIKVMPMKNYALKDTGTIVYETLAKVTAGVSVLKTTGQHVGTEHFKLAKRSSTRCLNIAIPKALMQNIPVFAKWLSETELFHLSSTYRNAVTTKSRTYTHGCGHVTRVGEYVGQRVVIRKAKDLHISVIMCDMDGNDIETLINKQAYSEPSDMHRIAMVCDVTEDAMYIYMQFIYNSNRLYRVTSNHRLVMHDTLLPTTLRVLSDKCRNHAIKANLLHDNDYLQHNFYTPITLPDIVESLAVDIINVYNWRSNEKYEYGNVAPIMSTENDLSWLGGEFNGVPVQVRNISTLHNTVHKHDLLTMNQNLNYFMILANKQIRQYVASWVYNTHTRTTELTNLQNCLYGTDLPIINNGTVFFKNIRYDFDISTYNGCKFTVILAYSDKAQANIYTKLLYQPGYVTLVIYAYLQKYISPKCIIKVDAGYQVAEDTQESGDVVFNYSFSGKYTKELTYDAMSLDDLYSAKAYDLLPGNVAIRMPEHIQMNTKNTIVDLDLPVVIA